MTTDAKEKPIPKGISRFWLVGLILLGFACYALTATVNFYYAGTMTISTAGMALMAGQAGVIDGFAFCFAGIGGGFWNARRRVAAGVIWIVAAGFMSFSIANSVGFGASERIGVVQVAAKTESNKNSLIRDENASAKKAHADTLANLKRMYNDADDNRDRSRLLLAMQKHASTPVVLKAEIVEAGATDHQAGVLGRWTGITASDMQEAIVLAGAVFVVLGKMLGPAIGVANWPAEPLRLWGWVGSFFCRQQKVDAEAGAQQPVAAASKSPVLATKQTIDLDRARDLALVREWVDQACVRVNRTHTEKAETVYGWFREWCQKQKKLGQVMTITRFGRFTAELDMPKVREKGCIVYQGLARKGVAPIDISSKQRRVA